MYRRVVLSLLAILFLTGSAALADVVLDNFDSGDLSAWNTTTPYYVTVGLVSPGNGGSGSALAITETAGTAHSIAAYAHRNVAPSQNWTAYKTLKIDAKISAGNWNGYSVRLANGTGTAQVLTFRGLHSTAAAGTWVTFSLDISTIQRDQITEINVYPNRTYQNAGQTLTIDNIVLSTTPAPTTPATMDYVDSNTYDVSRWQDPDSHIYQTTASATTEPGAMTIATNGTSKNAYGHCTPVLTQDWNDYATLQFDAKVPAGANTDGYKIVILKQGNPQSASAFVGYTVRAKKFVPGVGSYATCYVDISWLERDQISGFYIYPNSRGVTVVGTPLAIDNIKLTKVPAPVPDVLTLESFDTYTTSADMFGHNLNKPWDYAYNNGADAATWPALSGLDAITLPNSMDVRLSGGSSSAYVRRQFNLVGALPSLYPELTDYRSLMFDVKVTKGTPYGLTTPLGFSCNIVDDSGADAMMWFKPAAFDTWQTISLDITGNSFAYLKWLRFYDNRCLIGDVGQILRIDNIRVSKEPAPPAAVFNSPTVEDFEGADNSSWYYQNATTGTVVVDPVTGSSVLKVVNAGTSGSAYIRKTLHADWSTYKTLSFDARMANSTTNQGFAFVGRGFGGYGPSVQFLPTNQWKTYSFDISGLTRAEMAGLLFYVNRAAPNGTRQDGSQELYIDNIRLSTAALQYGNGIADAKNLPDGTTITLTGKITMGAFTAAAPDPVVVVTPPATPPVRDVFIIEEEDRSCALPVMVGPNATVNAAKGSKVNVTGTMASAMGMRFLYATAASNVDSTGVVTPGPVFLTNKHVGSMDRWLAAGVSGFSGLDTTGMYASITGRVMAASAGSGLTNQPCIYIDDGSNAVSDNGSIGVKVYVMAPMWVDTAAFPVGSYVRAQGFVMNDPELTPGTTTATGKIVRALWLDPDWNVFPPITLISPPNP